MRYWIIIFALSWGLMACSPSLTTVLSMKEEGKAPAYKMSEPSSKIRFHLSNDSEFLYLYLNSNDPVTCQKIMQTGLRIYFDAKAKRNTNCYIEYPMLVKSTLDPEEELEDLRSLRKKLSDDASYKRVEGSPHRFDVALSKTAVEVELSVEDSTALNYKLKMPLSWIGAEGQETLSFGLRSGSFSRAARFEVTSGGVEFGSRANRSGNFSKQSFPDQKGYYAPIEFWYAVELQAIPKNKN